MSQIFSLPKKEFGQLFRWQRSARRKKSSADSPSGADGDASVPVSPVPAFEPPPRKGPRKRYKGEVTNYVDPNPSYDESDLQPAEKRDPPTLLLVKISQTKKEFR